MEIENLLNNQSPAIAADEGRSRRRSKSPAEKSNASHEMSAVATTPQQSQHGAPSFSSPYQNHATPYQQHAQDGQHQSDHYQYYAPMSAADAAQLRDAHQHPYEQRNDVNSNIAIHEPRGVVSYAQETEAYAAHSTTSKGRPLSCSSCGKNFARRSDLVRHERIHNNDRPHTCGECGKQFIQRSALTVHERVHTGHKPHICEKCGKPFSDSSSLARHRRIHTGKRPYSCDFEGCTKTFTRRTTLTRHQNTHPPKDGNPASRTAAAALSAQGDTPESQSLPETDRTAPASQSPASHPHNSVPNQPWSATSVPDQNSQHYVQQAEHSYPPAQPVATANPSQRSLRSGRRAQQAVMTTEPSQGTMQHGQHSAAAGQDVKLGAHYNAYDGSSVPYNTAYDPSYMQGQTTPYFHQSNPPY